ncbi:MAG: hypothetical protein GY874_07695 [Desulfobacteraceae bacterium]|nr:hypothetical protein [Desulfobacteraceae bacterium]
MGLLITPENKNKLTKAGKKLYKISKNKDELSVEGKKLLKNTGIFDITEYGRAVHAEMEALLSCGRSGVSTRDCTLYTTTFPCHNCAKHIIAAGIERVVFVEPYPKSFATILHDDAIFIAHEDGIQQKSDKVHFEPFVGVGPRRFFDLFSMNLSDGEELKRKKESKLIEWKRRGAVIREPLLPISYIEKENNVSDEIGNRLNSRTKRSKRAGTLQDL